MAVDRLRQARELYRAFADGDREILTFAGDQIRAAEVYFGWELT